MGYRSIMAGLACAFCAAATAHGELQIKPSDVKEADGKPSYTYSLMVSSMGDPSKLEADASVLENVTLKSHQSVYFVSANQGETSAQIVYRFDFSDLPLRPASVTWRDRLTVFKPTAKKPGLARVVSEWSTDGESYKEIQRAESEADKSADVGDLMHPVTVELPDRPAVVYYRVRFEAVGDGSKFVGDRAQWNRSGTNAPLFRADFVLSERTGKSAGDGVSAQFFYPAGVDHLLGKRAYPAYVMALDSADGWRFLGATNGNRGGVTEGDAPERPGEKALILSVKPSSNPKAPSWLRWERDLKPELNIDGVTTAVFDVYPIGRPIDFPIMLQLGHERGFGIISATWAPLGDLKADQWSTVRIPVRQHRKDIDAIRLTFNKNKPTVPQDEEVRFAISNLRLEPAPALPAKVYTDGLTTASGVSAAYVQQTSPAEINEADPFAFRIEAAVEREASATLQVVGKNTDSGKARTWELPLPLMPPFTRAKVKVDGPMEALGAGPLSFEVALVDQAGRELARTSKPAPVRAFSSEAMHRERRELLEKTRALAAQAETLTKKGVVVAEPVVTLTVADWFLSDGGFVESDFTEQKEQARAMELLGHLAGMLARAESDLDARAAGTVKEHVVDDYRVGAEMSVEKGRLLQDGHPLLLIGPLVAEAPFETFRTLGFNSISRETRIKDWYNGEGRFGASFFDDYLRIGRENGLSVHMLLSSHYPPDPMPEAFEGANSPYTGVGMFPWDVLAPQTELMFQDWYDRMLPRFADKPALVSFGLANEAGYVVSRQSQTFNDGFKSWAKRQYDDIAQANKLWGSSYGSFAEIDLESFFPLRSENPGAAYDWERFVDEEVAAFFQRRKETLESRMPGKFVWNKLMGHERHFGFNQLNEHSSMATGQNVLGTDGHDPIWLDYLKSINPDWPVFNTEWHFMGNKADPNNQAQLAQRMVDGVVHGIQTGLIWTWRRHPWKTPVLGADQSITRWPRTLDVVGRTSLQMRGLAEPLTLLANVDGGKVRMLYSISANLHQDRAYVAGLHETYETLAQNATGQRFVFAHRLTRDDLSGVTLLAASTTAYLDASAAEAIQQWVADGGTLWLAEAVTWRDPWGQPLAALDAGFARALGAAGSHGFGKGTVVVQAKPDLSKHCDGPSATNADGAVPEGVDVRHAQTPGGGWLSLINRNDAAVTISLADSAGAWRGAATGMDVWNRAEVRLGEPIELPAYGVKLIQYGDAAGQ